jgi:hypothetical protein
MHFLKQSAGLPSVPVSLGATPLILQPRNA